MTATTSATGTDLDRFRPSYEQIILAQALLAASATVVAVVVPIALPDKQDGWWVDGQAVEYPGGLWVAHDRGNDYSRARDAASAAADRHLGDREGVAAYAVFRLSGDWAVFEDIRMIAR